MNIEKCPRCENKKNGDYVFKCDICGTLYCRECADNTLSLIGRNCPSCKAHSFSPLFIIESIESKQPQTTNT